MKIEQYDSVSESQRRALRGMILSDRIAAELAPYCGNGRAFPSSPVDKLAHLCSAYQTEYGKAPKGAIRAIFEGWSGTAEAQGDKASVEWMENFLNELLENNTQDDDLVEDHVIQQAIGTLNETRIKLLRDEIDADLTAGQPSKAIERVAKFTPYAATKTKGSDALDGGDALRKVLERADAKPLVGYKGELGRFFNRQLEAGNFVAVQAAEKKGKSTWLIDIAHRACDQGRRVLFYAAGDMGEGDMKGRFTARALNRPMYKGKYRYPTSMKRDAGSPIPEVVFRDMEEHDNLSYNDAMEALTKIKSERMGGACVQLEWCPTYTLSVAAIRNQCKKYIADGNPMEVVVVDYADILAAPPHIKEPRDRHNAIWGELRALSLELDILVVTATQANSDSYRKKSQDMRNFSEDKRKNAHATGIFGINQTDDEKRAGVTRLNWLVLREAYFDSSDHVYVAGCIDVSNPSVRSCR